MEVAYRTVGGTIMCTYDAVTTGAEWKFIKLVKNEIVGILVSMETLKA